MYIIQGAIFRMANTSYNKLGYPFEIELIETTIINLISNDDDTFELPPENFITCKMLDTCVPDSTISNFFFFFFYLHFIINF